jgi:hypothetical protein
VDIPKLGTRHEFPPRVCAVWRCRSSPSASRSASGWATGQRCTLCLEHPGFEVTLYLACSLRDIIHVIRGDLSLGRAIADDRLEVTGSRAARDALELRPLARVEPARAE